MLDPAQLADAAKRVALAATRPATVIVFGSYARGDATEASDLDLVVIEPELLDKAGEYLRLKAAVGRIGVGVDLLLRNPTSNAVARCPAPCPTGR